MMVEEVQKKEINESSEIGFDYTVQARFIAEVARNSEQVSLYDITNSVKSELENNPDVSSEVKDAFSSVSSDKIDELIESISEVGSHAGRMFSGLHGGGLPDEDGRYIRLTGMGPARKLFGIFVAGALGEQIYATMEESYEHKKWLEKYENDNSVQPSVISDVRNRLYWPSWNIRSDDVKGTMQTLNECGRQALEKSTKLTQFSKPSSQR